MGRVLYIFIFSLLSSHSYAQVSVSGHIRNQDKMPVPHATVLLHNLTDSIRPLVAFSSSNPEGFYSLAIPNPNGRYSLTVRAGSYKEITKIITFRDSSDFIQNFSLMPSVSYLDTVKIDMKFTISITGDTITFNPDSYARKNETTIEDLLKNIPGMNVKDDGKITFNGTPVSNVLIDGDDLFKRNYQQLTQNAAPKIIDKIEVIKNYQKDKLLKEFNQGGSQVINLKLKDQYKNYLFGNGAAGLGIKNNKLADVFLIKLSPQTKLQAGAHYNTTGNTYTGAGKFNIDDFMEMNEKSFFSYDPVLPLMHITHFYFQNIPLYYQQQNRSVQAYANALFKKNKWEHAVNVKIAEDTLRTAQSFNTIYPDGTQILENNLGSERNQIQEYNYSGAKTTEKESFYINLGLISKARRIRLTTESGHSLYSTQFLKSNHVAGQVNLSYIRKMKPNVLWTNTLGYFDQTLGETLKASPDLLFWLFPEELSLYNLGSGGDIKFRYAGYKSSLIIEKTKANHQFDVSFSLDDKVFNSALISKRLSDDSTGIPFKNNSHYHNQFITIGYTGKAKLSGNKTLTIKLINQPDFLSYTLSDEGIFKTNFHYDYSTGLSSKRRGQTWSINIGAKKQLASDNLFFKEFLLDGFHSLRTGFSRPFSTRSIYSQLSFNSFSVRRQMITFFMLNLSRNHDEYIRSLKTTGIATITSYPVYPNNTNSLILFFRTQKAFGALPFSLHPNVFFNWRSMIYSFDDKVRLSEIRSLNATFGVRTYFKSMFNFTYDFSVLNASNLVKSPDKTNLSTHTILNKVNLYIVKPKLFNTTLTYYNVFSRNIGSKNNFLDILMAKRFLKDKVLLELNLRNIFDNKKISTQSITPFSTRDNLLEIRGIEFFFKIRYEIR